MEDKISIIIPIYNVEKYLEKCLDSVIEQTYKNLEILCIDDGSNDNSIEILKKYQKKDSRIKIYLENHKGSAEARNKGIEVSCGKYIQFLDSDDYLDKSACEKLITAIKKQNADMVVMNATSFENNDYNIESNNPLWPINLEEAPLNELFSPEDKKDNIFSLFCVVPWNKIYKKELLTKNNIKFQNIGCFDDVYFGQISRLCANKIYISNEKIINYRQNRKNSLTSIIKKSDLNIILAIKEIKNYLIQTNQYDTYKMALLRYVKEQIYSFLSRFDDETFNNLINNFKSIFQDDKDYFDTIKQTKEINSDTINEIIKDKKVMFWGLSNFIKDIYKDYESLPKNILGIIDNNQSLWNNDFKGCKIYSPMEINNLKPDAVLFTIASKSSSLYPIFQKEFKLNYPNIKLLDNIFP